MPYNPATFTASTIAGASVTVTAAPLEDGILAFGEPGIRLATPSAPSNTKAYQRYNPRARAVALDVVATLLDGSGREGGGVVPFGFNPANLTTAFTSSNRSVATVSNAGVATSVAAGTTTIRVVWTDRGTDFQASVDETVAVNNAAAVQTVELAYAPGAPTSIRVGEQTVFRCRGKDASGAYVPSHSTAWSVSFTSSGSTPTLPPFLVNSFGVITARGPVVSYGRGAHVTHT